MPIPTATNTAPRQLLVDAVTEQIRDWILAGTLTPGETLHDEDLTAACGVSRTPVREALRRLQSAGLVVMVPNRHTTVAEPALGDDDDALEVLALLIDTVARTAPEHTTMQGLLDTLAATPTLDAATELRDQLLAAGKGCSAKLLITRNSVDGLLHRILTAPRPTATTAGVSA